MTPRTKRSRRTANESKAHGRITALEINGNQSKEEDIQKLRVVNGSDGTWSVRSEGKEISKGTSTFDPTKKPKTIDFTPTEGGGKGEKFLGIYQLRKNNSKAVLCTIGKGPAHRVFFHA